jgi:hypothetical protein
VELGLSMQDVRTALNVERGIEMLRSAVEVSEEVTTHEPSGT